MGTALFESLFVMRRGNFMKHLLRALTLAALILLEIFPTSAHEANNFCLPLDVEMADVGPFLETVHTMALQKAVDEINADIEKAIKTRNEAARQRRLERLHDPKALSKGFLKQFGHPMIEDKQLESALRGDWARQTYGGQKPEHQDISMNFSAHSTLDLRRWMMLTQSRTVKAYGVYFGADKFVHFHHLGAAYYWMYESLVEAGLGREEAYRKVIEHYAENGILSEEAIFGAISTGVYSNADLAANHVGFKFYMNLTEKVVLKGEEREPLLTRSGVFWRLNRHVRSGSGWFAAFISDHWNEALNPNRYGSSMRRGIRRILESRAKEIVQFYTQKNGRPEDPAYFDNLARELSTYYGEAYGHSGQLETLMTIGNTCIPAMRRLAAPGGN